MEISVTAAVAGTVQRVLCAPGQAVTPGQTLLILQEDN